MIALEEAKQAHHLQAPAKVKGSMHPFAQALRGGGVTNTHMVMREEGGGGLGGRVKSVGTDRHSALLWRVLQELEGQ